ncbi:MAG TPA: hypothetical protein PK263_00400 [bacterium]|nr:hypothetical protein [bacterium]
MSKQNASRAARKGSPREDRRTSKDVAAVVVCDKSGEPLTGFVSPKAARRRLRQFRRNAMRA